MVLYYLVSLLFMIIFCLPIEASGAFSGRFHALGGKLAPARRIGPERLRLAELKDRVVREGVREVLLALSTDMDGDATAGYVTFLDVRCRLTALDACGGA